MMMQNNNRIRGRAPYPPMMFPMLPPAMMKDLANSNKITVMPLSECKWCQDNRNRGTGGGGGGNFNAPTKGNSGSGNKNFNSGGFNSKGFSPSKGFNSMNSGGYNSGGNKGFNNNNNFNNMPMKGFNNNNNFNSGSNYGGGGNFNNMPPPMMNTGSANRGKDNFAPFSPPITQQTEQQKMTGPDFIEQMRDVQQKEYSSPKSARQVSNSQPFSSSQSYNSPSSSPSSSSLASNALRSAKQQSGLNLDENKVVIVVVHLNPKVNSPQVQSFTSNLRNKPSASSPSSSRLRDNNSLRDPDDNWGHGPLNDGFDSAESREAEWQPIPASSISSSLSSTELTTPSSIFTSSSSHSAFNNGPSNGGHFTPPSTMSSGPTIGGIEYSQPYDDNDFNDYTSSASKESELIIGKKDTLLPDLINIRGSHSSSASNGGPILTNQKLIDGVGIIVLNPAKRSSSSRHEDVSETGNNRRKKRKYKD